MTGKPSKLDVLLTAGAERDLESIYEYIAEFDCVENADYVLEQLMEAVERLSRQPARGSSPKELATLGNKEYRQVFFKPYRIVYRIFDKQVIIYLIADGRRDMQSLLAHRLLDT